MSEKSTEIYAHRISHHAVQRFAERIRPLPEDEAKAKDEMLCCLRAAKAAYLKAIDSKRKKRTLIVPTGCCYFVFAKGNMVTVLKDPPRAKTP